MKTKDTKNGGRVCVDCGIAPEECMGAGVNGEWLCFPCLVKRAFLVKQLKAERDYAIRQWVRLEKNRKKLMHPRHGPRIYEQLLKEIHKQSETE